MQLKSLVDSANHITFFGGAGVSTESGIPDFRSADGIYSTALGGLAPPEVILSASFFTQHPAEFFEFYRANLLHPEAKPNPAHIGLAHLESSGKRVDVVTQNIDGLHQTAGSRHVIELHGSVHRNYCLKCGARYDLEWVLNTTGIPRCDAPAVGRVAQRIETTARCCNGIVRPDVVLYEEALDPDVLEAAVSAIATADLLIIGGTSLVVYPAAALINYFGGNSLVVINRDASPADRVADLVIRKPIGQVFQELAQTHGL